MVSYALTGAETKRGQDQPYWEVGKSFMEVAPELAPQQHRERVI